MSIDVTHLLQIKNVSISPKRQVFAAIIIAILVFSAGNAQALHTLSLGNEADSIRLNPHIYIYQDPTNQLTVQKVADPDMADKFERNESRDLSLGFTTDGVWGRFTLDSAADALTDEWVVVLNIAPMEYAHLYVPRPDGSFEVIRGGHSVPLSRRIEKLRNYAYRIKIEPGSSKTFYMYMAAHTAMVIDLRLYTPQAHLRKYNRDLNIFLLLAGAFLTMLFYNLLVFVSARNLNYLYLFLFVTSIGMFLATNFGLAHRYLWPEIPYIARLSSPFFGSWAIFFGMLFARNMLDTKTEAPKLDIYFRTIAYIAFGLVVLTFIHSFYANVLVGFDSGAAYIMALVGIYYRVKKPYEFPRWFLLAMIVAIIGGIISVLMVFGYWGMNIWAFAVGPIALLIGLVFLGLATGKQIVSMQLKYAHIFNNVDEAILIWSLQNQRFIDINDKACELFGFDKQQMFDMNISDMAAGDPPYSKTEAVEWIDKTTQHGSQHFEWMAYKADGDYFWSEVSLRQTKINDQDCILIIVRDITEHKQADEEKDNMQAQLMKAQKMEAFGTLAGGVAHDFNNLLTAIQGNCGLAMIKLGDSSPEYHDLKEVQRAVAHGADLTRQLLLFSRKQHIELKPVDVNRIVENLLKMLNRLIGEDIEVNAELEPNLWAIRADEGNLEQIIMNLAVNARDAMPKGGALYIRTRLVDLGIKDIRSMPGARSGRFVRLTIQDNGIGIEVDDLPHIFEPFFTTKEIGKGTGLGLAVVYGLVSMHDGWINVQSEPGKGARFEIYIPAIRERPDTREQPRAAPIVELQGNGESILLIEDDDSVRNLVRSVLTRSGYTVFSAADGREALELVDKEDGNFEMVISDVVLPDESGPHLVEMLLKFNPKLKVLLNSGYIDDKSQRDLIVDRGFNFLQKPYDIDTLLRTVKEILAQP